jgi:hypothetical protein
VRGGPKVEQIITFSDRFGTRATRVRRAKLLCLPASRNGDPLADPSRDPGPPQALTLDSAFGTEALSLKKPKLLCVPSASMPCALLTLAKAGGGSAQCGGPDMTPAPAAPFAGATYDAMVGGTVVHDLGLGCSYTGGGQAQYSPIALDGDVTVALQTRSCAPGTLDLGPSTTPGAEGCQPAAIGRCLYDLSVPCTTDADCYDQVDGCLLAPRCHLTPPTPVYGAYGLCATTPITSAVAGTVDPTTGALSLSFSARTVTYFAGSDPQPCPRCLAGTCDDGPRAGLSCSVESAQLETSNDCPPFDQYAWDWSSPTALTLTTSSQTLSDGSGELCTGQATPGAFGDTTVRRITVTGAPAGALTDGLPHSATLAGLQCRTADGALAVEWDLPGPTAASMTVDVQLTQ